MERSREATLSRQNMSTYKTLYVEGDLDLALIEAYLINNKITNIRIYRIGTDKEEIEFGDHIPNREIGIKKQIIEFIKHSNEDRTIDRGKYLGIVDTDLDFCFSEKETIDNLLYTDFNSMESYLIDIDLFKVFARDYKIYDFSFFETNLEVYFQNFIEFNMIFIVQVKHYMEFNGNLITFDDVPLNCRPFVKDDCNSEICIDSVKYKINGCKVAWEDTYNCKKQALNDLFESCKENILYFLHGKHLLRYLIGICKNHYDKLQSISDEMIINSLKDKFIITLRSEQYALFQKIKTFAS